MLEYLENREYFDDRELKGTEMAGNPVHRLILSGQETACALGVTYATLSNWRNSDFPPPQNAPGKKYYSDEVVQYAVERERRAILGKYGEQVGDALNPAQERARKDKEQADKVGLENAVRRGELIEADSVITAGTDMVLRVRSRLLRVPYSVAPLLVGEEDRVVIQTTVEDMIRDALSELSVEWKAEAEEEEED